MPDHAYWMDIALGEAHQAARHHDVPVGAVLLDGQKKILATAHNRRECDHDPTAHAEILVLRAAAQRLGCWKLTGCTLYVTLEPCAMCAGAVVHARLGLLVYGCDDPKAGAVRSVLNLPDSALSFHKLSVISGIREVACRQILKDWFRERRQSDQLP